jgi:hypothetical protein
MFSAARTDFIIEKIVSARPGVLIIAYGLSALLFWLPSFRKKSGLSFLHSLALFLLPFCSVLLRIHRHNVLSDDYMLNLLRIYTAGFIMYLIALSLLVLLKWLLSKTVLLTHHKA